MKAIARCSIVPIILAFSGCTAIQGMPAPPRSTTQAIAAPGYLIEPKELADYDSETDLERKRILRNKIIDERLLEIDYQFYRFEQDLWRQGVGAGIGTDWVQLAVSGATATVGGESAKAALGAVSTALVGGKASFDKHAFVERTLPAMMAQMVAERESVRASIERSKLLSVVDYSLYAAMSDLRRLLRAGTIPGAIQTIAKDAGEKAAQADADIREVRTARFAQDVAGDRLRLFWKPDGRNINIDNERRLKKWMTDNGLTTRPGDITMFLGAEDKAELRARAVRELLGDGL